MYSFFSFYALCIIFVDFFLKFCRFCYLYPFSSWCTSTYSHNKILFRPLLCEISILFFFLLSFFFLSFFFLSGFHSLSFHHQPALWNTHQHKFNSRQCVSLPGIIYNGISFISNDPFIILTMISAANQSVNIFFLIKIKCSKQMSMNFWI